MNKISRRTFIEKTSGTLGLLQVDALARGAAAVGPLVDPKTERTGWHHLTRSGADLYFHLINGHPRCGELAPIDGALPSYLIVQLPAQSLHEQYFSTKPTPPDDVPGGPLQAMLSGPSFLAFELWPSQKGSRRRMPFTVEALLDWESPTHFRLLTIEDIPANPSEHAQPTDCWPQLNTKCEYKRLRPDPRALGKGGIYDLNYYKDLTQKLLNDQPDKYLTIFELPAGIITAPISGNRLGGPASDIRWTPIIRQNQAKCGVKTIYETRYSFFEKGKHLTREVRERWNAEIEFLPPKLGRKGGVPASLTSIRSLPPALRVIGLLDRGGLGDGSGIQCAPANPDPCADPVPGQVDNPGYLPTLLDEAELLYLNQLGKQCFRSEAFDLKVSGPFLLTALGATLKFHYQNFSTKGLGDQSISLVEYEHHFQDGRDNFIKVSRIGVLCPSGQKALHVMIAQRKIDQGRSFLEYKEHIEFIEKQKDYEASPKGVAWRWEDTLYFPSPLPKADKAPWPPGYLYPNALPFTRSEILWARTPNMQPVGSLPKSFWVNHELPDGAAAPETFPGLIQVPVQYYDQNRNKVGKVSFHPILFMARSFFCGPTGQAWVNGEDPTSLKKYQDQRIRIPLNGQIVAYTPDDPEHAAVPNRTNQLATEWCDYVVNVAQPSTTADSVFDTAKHPIYPQMRRAKVLLDHLQQYGGKKLPSIIAYHPDYLRLGLPGVERTQPVPKAAPPLDQNIPKLVLRHTNDFIDGTLVALNDAKLSGELFDPDLKRGWDNIRTTFRSAGARLGGMVNPEPLLERISLSPSALSLPDGPLDVSRLKSLDPQKIFQSADADLFCGIRLKDILATLDMDNLPQYLLSKLPDDFSDPQKALAAIGGNPVVQKVLEGMGTTAKIIGDLRATVAKANAELARAQEDFNKASEALKNQLPDYNKLFGVAQLQFRAALSAYRVDLDDQLRPLLMAFESMKALQDLGLKDATPRMADFLGSNVASLLDPQKHPEYTNSWKGLELANELAALAADLNSQTSDALTWAKSTDDILHPQKPWSNEEEKAQAVLKLITQAVSSRDVANQTAADRFYHRTALLTKLFDLVKDRLPTTEREAWEVGLRQVDLLRRTSAKFFEDQREQPEKELQGILRDAKLEMANEQAQLIALADSGGEYTKQLIKACQASGIVGAVAFASNPSNIENSLKKAQDAFKAELLKAAKNSSLYKELGEKLSECETLGDKVNAQKRNVVKAQRELTAQAQKEAGTLLDQLDQRFQEEIAGLNDAQEVQEARAAYAKLIQLLTALKRQELSLNWQTENFRAVDLGFVRFDPGTAPKTRLEMKVHAVMEMDPLRFPPVVQSTEVRTETRLTDFRFFTDHSG